MSETYRRKPPKTIEAGGRARRGPLKSGMAERTVKHDRQAQNIAASELHKQERHGRK